MPQTGLQPRPGNDLGTSLLERCLFARPLLTEAGIVPASPSRRPCAALLPPLEIVGEEQAGA